jgi:hypothetical protein
MMGFRCITALLACVLAWALTNPASAELRWPLVPGGAYFWHHPPYHPDNAKPGPAYPAQQQSANYGQYPWYGTAWGVPTYNWGYFGAFSYPTAKCQKTYYRDYLQWGQWRRY